MNHLPPFILDLALILITAGLVTVIFRKIGQPVVLGYIISGFLVSSHVWFFPTVTDLPNIQIWAEVGVIFLLFALGLEFSLKKLLRVGGPATLTALIEVIGMIGLGILCGQVFGWSLLNSVFLGGILAISSTTIIVRTISETGMKGRGFVDFVFGVLIVEDLFAVLLLVLLSTVAVTNQFNGIDLFFSALKLISFIVFCFVSGIFILPSVFKFIRKNIFDEMLLIVALALCFLMVILSTKAGFSPALGAFIMGAIIAETREVKKIEQLIKPVKDLFGAIFFVSVGMLINPKILMEYSGHIAILTLVTIFGKFFTILIGALISKRDLRHSIQAGLSLAQIGEFSFIIAGLGISLKVTNNFLYPIAVGVSVITTFITPYLITNIDVIYTWLEKWVPAKYLLSQKKKVNSLVGKQKIIKEIFSSSLTLIALNSVIIYSIFNFFTWLFPDKGGSIVFWLSLFFSVPFYWAILMSKNAEQTKEEMSNNNNFKDRIPYILIELTRILMVWGLFRYLASQYISPKLATSLTLFLTLILLFVFSPILKKIYNIFEKQFLKNFMESENASWQGLDQLTLAPWDAHLSHYVIPPESEFVGKTLQELKFRETFGISIALIERGCLFITAPTKNDELFPNDRITTIGTSENLENFSNFLKSKQIPASMTKIKNYALHKILVTKTMSFANKTILKSGIREKTDGLVAGIERRGEKILNPDSMLQIKEGDLLWIIGDSQKIELLN